jgi:hypothetical protein
MGRAPLPLEKTGQGRMIPVRQALNHNMIGGVVEYAVGAHRGTSNNDKYDPSHSNDYAKHCLL